MRRYKIIDEFPDEINDKIQSFTCGKCLLKMKMVLNEISQVISCNKKVQFRIVMERFDGIIKHLKAKETENKTQFILKNCMELVGGERMWGGGTLSRLPPNVCMLFSKRVFSRLIRPSGRPGINLQFTWGHS
jgi:hypothetical protein